MMGRIWQWLKRWFQRLFGRRSSTNLNPGDRPPPKPLEDADFEFLFRQLLEGVAHGWQPPRVLKFFEGLQGRTSNAEWVAWLQGFRASVLASRAANQELARRMVRLGEMTESIPSIQEIGVIAYQIGAELLSREESAVVWEYDGPDFDPHLSESVTKIQGDSGTQEGFAGETITVEELLIKLQEDPNLVQIIAAQLGLETDDPQVIIAEVNQRLDEAEQSATD